MKLVNLETAKALQELGYDGEYAEMYNEYEISNVGTKWAKTPIEIPAPRLDDVAYWIRDKYHISIEPVWCGTDYKWSVAAYGMDYKGIAEYFCVADNSYEDALEAAVTKAIEIINSRNKSEREPDKI